MTLLCCAGAALAAVAVDAILTLAGRPAPQPFYILQGQHVLLALYASAFATAHRDAQILLFFILPISARWIYALEIVFAFLGLMGTGDYPGFVGLCTAIGLGFLYVRSSGSAKGGKRVFREMRLRMERWYLQRKLDRAKRKRGLRVIRGEKGPDRGPWVN
jgi:hypothetical protein